MRIFKIIRRCFGKVMFLTLGKILPSKGFRRLRTHWARMLSKDVDKKANIQRGAYIAGDGTGLHVGYHAAIGINCKIGSNCSIGAGTMMGPECIILTQNHKFEKSDHALHGFETKPVVIGEKCWIGTRVIILPGAKIGNHCIVGAGSVVPAKEYPDYSLIAGNPAIVKKNLLQ